MLKFLLVVAIFAAVTYFVTRKLQEHGDTPVQRRPARPSPPARPVAPDDDEDFLRDIDRRRRRNPPDDDPL
ncbi:MAG TPA: hypothetical protein VNS55_06845 [Nocardioides sp.]|nr:hypothetical protein [Nocardioides sp.]